MSSVLRTLSVRIRRGDKPVYRFLYKFAKSVLQFQIPAWRPFHSLLYAEWCMRRSFWHNFWRVLYYEPMFKSQCKSVGKNFVMEYAGNGSTRIFGDLQVSFGDNVRIFDNTQFVGLKIFDKPELKVGDNTYLGPLVRFMVARQITIGSHCLITSRIVTDNPGHSTDDVMSRMQSAGGGQEKIA